MQKVIMLKELSEVAEYMEAEVFQYIGESQIESFESFETFNLLAFDWYDVHSERIEASKILIYMDDSDIFFIVIVE